MHDEIWFASEGTNLYAIEQGRGQPILALHGGLADHRASLAYAGPLAADYRLITPDLRGAGRSQDAGPLSWEQLADDLAALLDHLGIERAVVGGMSQGGYAALRAALVYPHRVQALVLIGADAAALSEQEKANSRGMFATWESMGPVNALIKPIAKMILGAPERWEPWVSQWKAIAQGRLAEPARCLTERDDISHRLPEITCPALVIHGTDDSSIPIERAEILARGLSGCAGLVQVAGAPHASNLTHPEQVNAALLAFLRACV